MQPGERVVTDGALYLEDDERIEIVTEGKQRRRQPRRPARSGQGLTRRAPRRVVMSLLEFPIRRYPFTLIVFLCLAVLGWFAFSNIPREEDPYFKIPVFFITAIFPGADPKDLERLVAKPIEDRLAELDDVKKIETTVVDGVASIAHRVRGRHRCGQEVRRSHARGERAAPDAAAGHLASSRSARSAPGS